MNFCDLKPYLCDKTNCTIMKKIITNLILFLFLGSSVAYSENLILPSSTSIVIYDKKEKNEPVRPKAPSRQQILCIYENEHLNLSFAIPEGECQLTVMDMTTGFARQYVFDSSGDATINVGTLTQAHIEISTANGHEYEGWLGME